MKKKFLIIILALAMLLAACGGNISSVSREIGESERYTTAEINSAMKVVANYFRSEFKGCTLTRLSYNEEKTAAAAEEWAAQYDAEEAIILLSSFDVGPFGGDGSLNPSSTYENWQWILTRSGDTWTLRTWGYG